MDGLSKSFWLVAFALVTMSMAKTDVEPLHAVVEGTNQFSSLFFQYVVGDNSGNLIISPLSVDVVLAMVGLGAGGNTEAQFRKVLSLPTPNNLAAIGYQTLIDNLNSVKDNILTLANKIFIAESLDINPSYKNLTEVYFRSASESINFVESTKASETINTWVEKNTNNLIKNLISPDMLNAGTRLVLVNAVYFKGQWLHKFNTELTMDMPFHVNKDTVKNVATMYREGYYKYGELPNLNARFVVLPYKGNELSMLIILPNEIEGLLDVQKKLQNVNLTDILNQGIEEEIRLHLPKFKVESKMILNKNLIEMGLTDAFTASANFSGISNEKLAVDTVVQKAFIEVNEEGTEAAAATGIVMLKMDYYKTYFTISRPFVYYIVRNISDKKGNDNILSIFSGYVEEP
ncbi:antichymotrypsin-2-like isoform X1 [Frieseomelitta varia]|uniref:antichymotrypsin-2-like isoform X1 n=2 Tax=Frieseomelitta varia TaxID=561572 RepID=UPI001CB6AD00|nr:antichymotrypsin-2-like isoform X1 [Frieseomelitta varia]XP_043519651.1 antichymotrypsin-2-like isoform X1 [Frieseomelitta varia]